ncbi:MAG: hypothetical protein OEZ39_07740 [Gammaproteobacteria bacterium]|nr:hypothetical protein [Gammaproteobacteria bacterium]MDH5651751.1 hypothetical protein [Gammaproteobacteria bacterium]
MKLFSAVTGNFTPAAKWAGCVFLSTTLAFTGFAHAADKGEKDKPFNDLYQFEGKCIRFMQDGKDTSKSCEGKMSYISLKNGRAVFTVFLTNKTTLVFSGGKETDKKDFFYRLEIDQVYRQDLNKRVNDDSSRKKVSGQCQMGRIDDSHPTITCSVSGDKQTKIDLEFYVEKTNFIPLPKLPTGEEKKKIINHCGAMAFVGIHYNDARKKGGENAQAVGYIMEKFREKAQGKDVSMLEKPVGMYVNILSKHSNLKPTTNAVYVKSACVVMLSMRKAIPDDAASIAKLDQILKNCETGSQTTKDLDVCIGRNLGTFVFGKYYGDKKAK